MTLTAAQTVFWYLAGASVVSAILAVTRRNPVHSMLWLLALFLHVAGQFLLLGAEFLAVVQVIVYAGAILVFYLFVLMLLDLPGEERRPRYGAHWPFALAGGVSLVALAGLAMFDTVSQPLLKATSSVTAAAATASDSGSVKYAGDLKSVGNALFRDFALPFELASLVLLAAIIGAVVLAGRKADAP
ncbi:MAG: NADH-quinone oxidoreductase subunit J [Planctomycetaceae bacterium]